MKKAAALILVVVMVTFVAQMSFASADEGKATFSAKCAVLSRR
jgi:hypothetical protein